MKTRLSIIIKILIFSFFLFSLEKHTLYALEKIMEFNTTTRVYSNGKIFIIEDIKYDFGSEQRHGIFRNIPYKKTNQEGKKFIMKLEDFNVEDGKGNKHNFPLSFFIFPKKTIRIL